MYQRIPTDCDHVLSVVICSANSRKVVGISLFVRPAHPCSIKSASVRISPQGLSFGTSARLIDVFSSRNMSNEACCSVRISWEM